MTVFVDIALCPEETAAKPQAEYLWKCNIAKIALSYHYETEMLSVTNSFAAIIVIVVTIALTIFNRAAPNTFATSSLYLT